MQKVADERIAQTLQVESGVVFVVIDVQNLHGNAGTGSHYDGVKFGHHGIGNGATAYSGREVVLLASSPPASSSRVFIHIFPTQSIHYQSTLTHTLKSIGAGQPLFLHRLLDRSGQLLKREGLGQK